MENKPLSQELSTPNPSPPETAAARERTASAVEKHEPPRWVEIACAVLLSLATTASAWCAYQSTLWGGVQTFRLNAANSASRKAGELNIVALEFRSFDAALGLAYMEAIARGDKQQQEFLRGRFRPELQKAMDAWLATDPMNNPKAPRGPFMMAEYVQQEVLDARQQEKLSEEEFTAAQHANEASDNFLLLTVMFASVLFFGGIGGTFQSRWLRIAAFYIALALFAVTLVGLANLPICRE